MKLLLDEHYTPAIAEQLRARGHDVDSVGERRDLRSLDDRSLFAASQAERRTILTNNVRDFMPLVQQAAAQGDDHHGVVFTNDRSLPRSKRTIGTFVELLDSLLSAHPTDGSLRNQVRWLP